MEKKEISRRDFLRVAGTVLSASLIPQRILDLSTNPDSVCDIGEILPTEIRKGVVVADNMPVYMFPVRRDYFNDYWKDRRQGIPATIEEYTINGVELGYLNLFTVHDPGTNQTKRFTILPHTTGQRGIPIALFDSGYTTRNGEYQISTRHYSTETEFTPSGIEQGIEHSIFASFYPNKLLNILEAMKAIDDFQQNNRGFVAGREYSMLEILDIFGRDGYRLGLNSGGNRVTGGGVCVVATNMCKLQTLMGAEIKERWQHPTAQRYSSSPLAGWILRAANSDATVEDSGNNQSNIFDFKWIAPKSGYIRLTAALLPNNKKVNSDFGDGEIGGEKADASILATFRWSTTNPGDQSPALEESRRNYQNYRDGTSAVNLSSENRFIRETSWRQGDLHNQFLNKISPEERTDKFTRELTTNPFLAQLVTLRNLINNYDINSPDIGVGTYLKNTAWYRNQISRLGEGTERNKLESALRHLDQNTNLIEGQPVQCFGLAVLLAGISDPLYSFKDIGGATKENGLPVTCAADLVPASIRNGSRLSVWCGGMNIRSISQLDEINPGDLFVLYNTTAGHVGAVIGKKSVGGETILLCTAANQTSEGDMKIFQVDGNNFDVVMGPEPFKKIIIR